MSVLTAIEAVSISLRSFVGKPDALHVHASPRLLLVFGRPRGARASPLATANPCRYSRKSSQAPCQGGVFMKAKYSYERVIYEAEGKDIDLAFAGEALI